MRKSNSNTLITIYLLVTSSAWRNTAQAALGGVDLFMNKGAENCLNDVIKIKNRIVKAIFAWNPETTIIVVYSPTNDKKNEAEVSTLYNNLRQEIDSTPNTQLFGNNR